MGQSGETPRPLVFAWAAVLTHSHGVPQWRPRDATIWSERAPRGNGSFMNKITPFLWFDDQAEAAVAHYLKIFENGEILSMRHYPADLSGPSRVMSITFAIAGQELIAFNGGPHFKFTEAVSLFVDCHTQREVDTLWEQLSAGGATGRCGWLKDKFGLSWQIIPRALAVLLQHKDHNKAERVMQAMMQMSKIDIDKLQEAADSPSCTVAGT